MVTNALSKKTAHMSASITKQVDLERVGIVVMVRGEAAQ